MKGIKKLNKNITKILYELTGFDFFKAKLGDHWVALNDKDEVRFIVAYDETDIKQDGFWKEWISNTYGWEPPSMWMLSILHEIGHLMTFNLMAEENPTEFNFSADLSDDCDNRSRTLCTNNQIDTEEFKKINLEYFSIPIERVATDWAVLFYRTHTHSVDKAWIEIQKAMRKFYKKNNVKED